MNDINFFFKNFDLLVFASKCNESCPLVILEAYACGKSVVATDVGGVRDIVREGVTGLVVPPDDPAEFANAVCTLLDSPELLKKMNIACKETFKSEFSAAQMANQYCKLIHDNVDYK